MDLRVLHHDRCFDGACSAALFTKLHRECLGGASGYEYRGLSHQPQGFFDDRNFGPGENAIVDFRYSSSPRMTWWFDHHETTFRSAEDAAHFWAGQSTDRAAHEFFNPHFVSCTGLIARVGRERFGLDLTGLDELLRWADIIDGARFESAQSAVEMKEPALKLALVIENTTSDDLIPRLIPLLTVVPMEEILAQPFVQQAIGPLWATHQRNIGLIRERAHLGDGVIYFNVMDQPVDAVSKFIPYALYPQATYTIGLSRSPARIKISVGTNPWTTRSPEDLINLARVCDRFGGGGHARVGAISFSPDQISRGEEVALGIVEELRETERQR